ncbi:transcriptional regulator LysR family [Caballeronia insecticola]|uniref:Transcriptional regulator LysR family n=1 Tax=Caballeronia insecticola TaxID=758793 RepID=R4WT67_9BURK|nr:transcriptional regulator LysR family [Caballeronia insecticola]BAN27793.1 transcriptional regulator LysR family [Caballeronia insecticola]
MAVMSSDPGSLAWDHVEHTRIGSAEVTVIIPQRLRRWLARGRAARVHRRLDPFRALWSSGRMTPPNVRVFVDFLSRHLFPEDREAS